MWPGAPRHRRAATRSRSSLFRPNKWHYGEVLVAHTLSWAPPVALEFVEPRPVGCLKKVKG